MLFQIPNKECSIRTMPSWLIYSSAPLRGLPLNGSWNFLSTLSRNGQTSRSFFSRDSSNMTLKYPCQLSLRQNKIKESQSKYLWRDFRVWRFDVQETWYSLHWSRLAVTTSNHTPSTNKSNSKSHMEATSLIRLTSRRHNCKSKPGDIIESTGQRGDLTSTTVTFNCYFWTV